MCGLVQAITIAISMVTPKTDIMTTSMATRMITTMTSITTRELAKDNTRADMVDAVATTRKRIRRPSATSP